jgi:hypothetical protein
MGRIPKGWKKSMDNENVIGYSKNAYTIYLWKNKQIKQYTVEPFRKLANYKRRLFKRDFISLSDAKRFAWSLMRQKEIRGYYSKNEA